MTLVTFHFYQSNILSPYLYFYSSITFEYFIQHWLRSIVGPYMIKLLISFVSSSNTHMAIKYSSVVVKP